MGSHLLLPPLPTVFCWTRFGTEAGETIEQILERKERERAGNGGVFLWGVGNSIAPSLARLLECERRPEVLFSPIKSAPRVADVAPARTAVWSRGRTVAGELLELPAASRVTSRFESGRGSNHYALVCAADEPLVLLESGLLVFDSLTNLVSGRKLGASQVTAVVRRDPQIGSGAAEYSVALRARLVAPYFLRLEEATVDERRAA